MSLFQTKEKDGTVNLRVCGYVTKDPYIPESGKIVLFSVCYGKDKYIDCKVWTSAKCGQLAACLEKHDEVAVDGILEEYTDKDGKKHPQIRVDHLSVQMEAPQEEETGAETSPAQSGSFTELNEDEEGGELPF